jgi:exosortase
MAGGKIMSTLITKSPITQVPLPWRKPKVPPSWLNVHAGPVMTVCLGLALIWSYWPILGTLTDRFWRDPQYSHGFLVPFFSLFLLWYRRDLWLGNPPEPSIWGLPLLVGGVVMRLFSARIDDNSIESFSIQPMLAGVVALVGGWKMLRWCWPAIAFLGFMMWRPYSFEQALSMPLRKLATVMCTFMLETLGSPAVADGNNILLDDVPLKIADACSGLGMLVTFFTMSTALAMLLERNWLEKTGIVLCAIPIAVFANVLRITATGLAQVYWGSQAAHLIMHDLAGWLMMPLALLMLWFCVWLADRVFPRMDDAVPLMVPGLKA